MGQSPVTFIVKRSGQTVPFDPLKIRQAVFNCLTRGCKRESGDPTVATLADGVTERVVAILADEPEVPTVEHVQDLVEAELLRAGDLCAAREYIIYREDHKRARESAAAPARTVRVKAGTGDFQAAARDVAATIAACTTASPELARSLAEEVIWQAYDGIPAAELRKLVIMAARLRMERDLDADDVARDLVLDEVYREVCKLVDAPSDYPYALTVFRQLLLRGVEGGRYTPQLTDGRFDIDRIEAAIRPERDRLFQFAGAFDIADRYLRRLLDGRRLEAPQHFLMRVAMGLSLAEDDPTRRAIEFYEILSTHRFSNGTPTLFNSGSRHPQMSSCYLVTVPDDLGGIFKVIRDNALLSKWAGGLGNDWTPLRAAGAVVTGTGGESKGVIPFAKAADAEVASVTQGEIRKGANCFYLEVWHLDIERFLDLRRGTGDHDLRTPHSNTAVWACDLFFKRVDEDGRWTLFCPSECPDLHDLYGRAFEERYEHYEREAAAGRIKRFKVVGAVELWRLWLSRLYETGHPWVTFKDPGNLRNPQRHAGVVHSSNLCTEIFLNTKPSRMERQAIYPIAGETVEHWKSGEIAVCNLGSVNLAAHVDPGSPSGLNLPLLYDTVTTAMRMLDNVIDLNYYPVPEAQIANMRHRPVGLGQMGFQDALWLLGIDYASQEAVDFADASTEAVAYFAISASSNLAAERGRYSSYEGSDWSQGILPQDTLDRLELERGRAIRRADRESHVRPLGLDWEMLRAKVVTQGMRNSHTMAIAPTATIGGLFGVEQSIEPRYKNLHVKEKMGGLFVSVNRQLYRELRRRGLLTDAVIDKLKAGDGTYAFLQDVIPEEVRRRFPTAFDISQEWLIRCAAARQRWIDQGQSLNLYLDKPSGRQLHEMYMRAWEYGLKSTYYLRGVAAGTAEKSTVDSRQVTAPPPLPVGAACDPTNPDCEACQ